ncbi:MAG: hypothetical protein GY822_08295 [Deltaproteobacteria bacterium]|nr:hypothetical protein [Deltaproteobacteria bacterium]
MQLVLSPLLLLLCVLVIVAFSVVVHFLVRRKEPTERFLSNPLRHFAPRGGRARFPVRLLEVGLLCGLWGGLAALLGNLAPVLDELPGEKQALAAASGGLVIIGTWWAWRRGALRDSSQAQGNSSAVEEDE